MSPKEQDTSRQLNRRDVLKIIAQSLDILEKGYLVYELGKLGIEIVDWGMSVPDVLLPAENMIVPGNPHWPEAAYPDRPVFIDSTHKGHKDFLVYLSTHDPILQKMHELAFNDLFFDIRKTRISLYESFSRHIEYAKKILRNTNARPIDYVHAAMFTFASVNSNFYTVGDVWHSFQVWDYARRDSDSTYIDIGKYIRNTGVVFPDRQDDNKQGIDTIMHFAGFGFIAFEKWYTTEHNLPDRKRIPRFADLMSSLSSDSASSSELLAAAGEFAWEIDETQTWLQEMYELNKIIAPHTGIFEFPGLGYDVLASYMGAHFAMMFAKRDITFDEIDERLTVLHNPENLWPTIPMNTFPVKMGYAT